MISISGMSFDDVVITNLIKLCLYCVSGDLFCSYWAISSGYLFRCFCCFDILINLVVSFAWSICFNFLYNVSLLPCLGQGFFMSLPLWESFLLMNIRQLTWLVNPMSLIHQIRFLRRFEDEWVVHLLSFYLTCASCFVSRINAFLKTFNMFVEFLNCFIKRV